MKTKKKVAVLFSGGKDSCLVLHKVLKGFSPPISSKSNTHLRFEVKYLLSIIPENFDSFMFHKPYPKLLKKQAELLGIKLKLVKSKGKKEKELQDLKYLIHKVKNEIDVIVSGGIASDYQGSRIKKTCDELELGLCSSIKLFSRKSLGRIIKRKI